jgi:hypothetical protein
MPVAREHQLYEKLARYLQQNYPSVIYRFDLAADLKLTKGQAAKFKRLHPNRGYPDLFIAEPRIDVGKEVNGMYELTKSHFETKDNPIEVFNKPDNELYHIYNGLYLELKAEGNSPFKKDGTLKKDQHLEEQMAILEKMRRRGYRADFATGFEEAKQIIDDYLGGEE